MKDYSIELFFLFLFVASLGVGCLLTWITLLIKQ